MAADRLILFTPQQITDLSKALEQINTEYRGYGRIVITIKKSQPAAIGIEAEWRYELESKNDANTDK